MKLTPLAPRPSAVAEALARRGVPPSQADAAAAGLQPAAVVLDDVPERDRDAIAGAARAQGLAFLSGAGWALLAGDTARLAGLGRSASGGGLPAALEGSLGRALGGVLAPVDGWATAHGVLGLARPLVMGILNLTPDSFSDGGRWTAPADALAHAERLLADGADLLDLGAESTRPGRPAPVPEAEEWRRLAPVLTELVRRFPAVPLSVDTVKGGIARRALDGGAWIVNDVSGGRLDPDVIDACGAAGAGLLLMHSRGALAELATYDHATYASLMDEVADELEERVAAAEGRGVARDHIAVDPGFGFAKRPAHNLQLLERLEALRALGRPLVVGPSRKRFLGEVTGRAPAERDAATAAACVLAYERGAQVFRVHAVRETRDALAVAYAARVA